MLQKINFPKLILFAAIGGIIIGVLFYFLEKKWNLSPYYRVGAFGGITIFLVLNIKKYFLKK